MVWLLMSNIRSRLSWVTVDCQAEKFIKCQMLMIFSPYLATYQLWISLTLCHQCPITTGSRISNLVVMKWAQFLHASTFHMSSTLHVLEMAVGCVQHQHAIVSFTAPWTTCTTITGNCRDCVRVGLRRKANKPNVQDRPKFICAEVINKCSYVHYISAAD